jgi:hypothetical protein
VGRKNHYGSRSERGTRTAALFYSLIESAKLCGVEPRAYLREATRRANASASRRSPVRKRPELLRPQPDSHHPPLLVAEAKDCSAGWP